MPYAREHPELAPAGHEQGLFRTIPSRSSGCRVGRRRTGMRLLDLRFQLSVRVVQFTRASVSTGQLGRRQPGDSDEVVRGGDQVASQLSPRQTTEARRSEATDRLHPTEDLHRRVCENVGSLRSQLGVSRDGQSHCVVRCCSAPHGASRAAGGARPRSAAYRRSGPRPACSGESRVDTLCPPGPELPRALLCRWPSSATEGKTFGWPLSPVWALRQRPLSPESGQPRRSRS